MRRILLRAVKGGTERKWCDHGATAPFRGGGISERRVERRSTGLARHLHVGIAMLTYFGHVDLPGFRCMV